MKGTNTTNEISSLIAQMDSYGMFDNISKWEKDNVIRGIYTCCTIYSREFMSKIGDAQASLSIAMNEVYISTHEARKII